MLGFRSYVVRLSEREVTSVQCRITMVAKSSDQSPEMTEQVAENGVICGIVVT